MTEHVPTITIAVFIGDNFTITDATGPHDALRLVPGAEVVFVSDRPGPKSADTGSPTIIADHAVEDVPLPDVLVVTPGFLHDKERVLAWIAAAHRTSRWTTSVCAGSLLLGSAGLLQGKRATSNWLVVDELARFGAIPCPGERYVRDGKIVTAAGTSAGIDMGIYLAGRLAGDDIGQAIQLSLEYDPQPPYTTGSPATAPPAVQAAARRRIEQLQRDVIARSAGLQF